MVNLSLLNVKEERKKNRVYKKDKRSMRKIECEYEFSRSFLIMSFYLIFYVFDMIERELAA